MNWLKQLIGSGQQKQTTPAQVTSTSILPGVQISPYGYSGGVYSNIFGSTVIYNPSMNLLDVKNKLNSLQVDSTKLDKVNKELELINNLNPLTIEIIQLAYEISRSDKLDDLKKMDDLVKKRLFSSKLEDIISE